ncbi:hypothetical protein [Magnetovibrio sp.]|uniref:hypothetical protein n=1 Tax=Magnetovibrio sp. TaxID=2024836 RepID=UPI002F91E62A
MLQAKNFKISFLKFSLVGALGLSASACIPAATPQSKYFSSQAISDPNLPSAPLPTVNPGDKFYYTNGWMEQVVSTNGETIDMINKAKRKLVNFRNFAIPAPYLEGSTSEYFKETRVPTNAMWPLRVGNSVSFSTEGRSVSKATKRTSQFSQKWSCAVEGVERVRVLAGEFDTFRVKCERRSSTNKWWQSYTWYYAPLINAYVLRRSYHKTNGESVRELTAVRPSLTDEPQNVRVGIIRTWQDALENAQGGEIRSWTDKKTGTSTQVEPLATYRAKSGLFCRTYKQYLTRQGKTSIYAGVACRTDKLKWRTPTRG